MYTLGIETSCDETSCAVLKDRDELLSNVVSSSLFRHKPFGGVVPEIASRHSLEQIDAVLQEALDQARVTLQDIGLVAVTYGPGLIGSLFVGVAFAKTLAYRLGLPLIGVNHLEAHLVASFIGAEVPGKYIGLLISGGHTSLSYHEADKIKLLGETIDDAVGEAFDKVAKMLGLSYPGGPVIEKLAKEGNPQAFLFTKPKQDQPFGFSFSGVKTAVRVLVEKYKAEGMGQSAVQPMDASPALPPQLIADVCASFQSAAVSWLVDKTMNAALLHGVQHVVIGGGVSANQYLKDQLALAGSPHGIQILCPAKILSLDNAGMIARRGKELFDQGERSDLTLTGVPNLAFNACPA